MEDDKKIFVNWLKQAIKIDGLITGKELATKVGVDPSTISGYLTGRTKGPELELRIKICKAMEVNYSDTIQAGRSELTPPQDIDQKIKAGIQAAMEPYKANLTTPPTNDMERWRLQKNKDHHDKINEFDDQETALNINSILVEIEKIDKKVFKKIERYVKLELDSIKGDRELRGEAKPNGTDN